jgi:hypothetical protein
MPLTKTWDETVPNNSTNANQIDDKVVDFKVAERERQAVEHCRYEDETGHTDIGEHKKGSARIGFGLAVDLPTVNSNNPGKVYKETDTGLVKLDKGTAWEELISVLSTLTISGGVLNLGNNSQVVSKDADNAIELISLLSMARISGKAGTSLNVNCYVDGGTVHKIDPALSCSRLIVNSNGTILYYKASAGAASPVTTWDLYNNVTLISFADDGTVTFNGTLSGAASDAVALGGIAAGSHQRFYNPSNTVIVEKLAEQSYTAGDDKLFATFTIYTPGIYRITWDMKNNFSLDNNAFLRLQTPFTTVAAQAFGPLTTAYVAKTWEVFIPALGTIELRNDADFTNPGHVKNIRLRGTIGATPVPNNSIV